MKYEIGTKYMTRGKHPDECTVIDYYITRNLAGDIVKTNYASIHQFCGQTVVNYDVAAATIAMGLIK